MEHGPSPPQQDLKGGGEAECQCSLQASHSILVLLPLSCELLAGRFRAAEEPAEQRQQIKWVKDAPGASPLLLKKTLLCYFNMLQSGLWEHTSLAPLSGGPGGVEGCVSPLLGESVNRPGGFLTHWDDGRAEEDQNR
ncbi:hypothetical protein EYF80_012310 [Liparis tanakae]|uniref:Uncharacterized protein n=1 Tax=Liparis tanakae TaxID=230148 RepID=A0A4Z2IHU0_9TELE|nr:hypothetical protein EYF80_012310 [Liparis tanakae]